MKTIRKRINNLQMYSIQNGFAAYGVNFKNKYRLEIYINVFGKKHPIKIYHGNTKPLFRNIYVLSALAITITAFAFVFAPFAYMIYLYIEGFYDLFAHCSKLFAWTIIALIIGLTTALILK